MNAVRARLALGLSMAAALALALAGGASGDAPQQTDGAPEGLASFEGEVTGELPQAAVQTLNYQVAMARAGLERWRGREFKRPVTVALEDRSGALAGWYTPGSDRLVVAAGGSPGFAFGVLLHELHHALQDQHFDLTSLRARAPNPDSDYALTALIEGEAMLAVAEVFGYDFESHAQLPGHGAVAPGRFDQIARYREGMRFVRALRERGGWAAVDAAFAQPPRTSAEILHPERFPSPEPAPLEVPPALSGLWREADPELDTRLGEIALLRWLSVREDTRAQADELAAALENDRLRSFAASDGSDRSLWVWDLRFTDPALAASFAAKGTESTDGWTLEHRDRDVRLRRTEDGEASAAESPARALLAPHP